MPKYIEEKAYLRGMDIMSSISYSASDFLNKITNSGNAYISNYSKRVREADTNVQNLQEQLITFRKNIRNLRNYDSDSYNRDQIERQITSFVKSYNDLKSASDKADNSNIKKQMNKLEETLSDHEKSLKKLGIKVSDKKLKFDTDTFDDVSDKDAKKIFQTLFEGSDSFISKVYKIGRDLEKSANTEEYQMNLRSFHTTTRYSNAEIDVATMANEIKNTSLPKCQSVLGRTDDDAKSIRIDSLKEYIDNYNKMIAQDVDCSAFSAIKELQESKKDELAALGITIEDDNSLTIDESVEQDSTFCNTYDSLFATDSTYVSQMKQLCDKTINTVLKADKLGITLDISV